MTLIKLSHGEFSVLQLSNGVTFSANLNASKNLSDSTHVNTS